MFYKTKSIKLWKLYLVFMTFKLHTFKQCVQISLNLNNFYRNYKMKNISWKSLQNNDVKSSVNQNCVNRFSTILSTNRKICFLDCIKVSWLKLENLKFYGTITTKNEKLKNVKVLQLTSVRNRLKFLEMIAFTSF